MGLVINTILSLNLPKFFFIIQELILKFAHNLLTLYLKSIKFLGYIKIGKFAKALYIKDFKNLKNITKSLINFKSCHSDHLKSPYSKGFFDYIYLQLFCNNSTGTSIYFTFKWFIIFIKVCFYGTSLFDLFNPFTLFIILTVCCYISSQSCNDFCF